jgi:glycosyltransferase involved in cell wall biosynthesis
MLMAAFARLKMEDHIPHRLFLVGPNPLGLPLREIAERLGIADSVVQTDGRWDDHHELIQIYNAADLYVYPSAYDGFSLTIVEAMACGLPVVTVNRAAIKEIANGSALLIEEPEIDALVEAMRRALGDESLREKLRAGGIERAGTLRWSQTARLTLDSLRRTVEGS